MCQEAMLKTVPGGTCQRKYGSILFPPPQCFYDAQLQIICCYLAVTCKKIAHVPGGHKRFMLTKLGGGGQNRIDPKI